MIIMRTLRLAIITPFSERAPTSNEKFTGVTDQCFSTHLFSSWILPARARRINLPASLGVALHPSLPLRRNLLHSKLCPLQGGPLRCHWNRLDSHRSSLPFKHASNHTLRRLGDVLAWLLSRLHRRVLVPV